MTRGTGRRSHFSWVGLALVGLALQIETGCCLVRPPDAETLVEAGNKGFRTPEAAFETFRAAFAADLPDLGFRCLSMSFREERQLTALNYRLALQQILDSKPYLAFLGEAKVVDSAVISAGRHRLVVEARGRRFEVVLVREDWFQIYSGATFLADGPVDFDGVVSVKTSATEQVATVELHVPTEDLEGSDLSSMTGMRVERRWKIAGFGEALAP